jgi:hypothetical protein
MTINELITALRDNETLFGTWFEKVANEAADRLEELDERVAIIDADWSEAEKDAIAVRMCREGSAKKYIGRGVVMLNYAWWRERIEKTGFRAVPTDEDMEGAEHEARPRTPDVSDLR